MIQLSNAPNIQVQVGEAIAVMAEWDFPLQWGDLVNVCPLPPPSCTFVCIIADRLRTIAQQLISNFSTDNFVVNNAVLQTAHAIFRRWVGFCLCLCQTQHAECSQFSVLSSGGVLSSVPTSSSLRSSMFWTPSASLICLCSRYGVTTTL